MKKLDKEVTQMFIPVVNKANPQFGIISNNNVGTNQVKVFNINAFMTWDIFPIVTDLNLLSGGTSVRGFRDFKLPIVYWPKVMVPLSPRNCRSSVEPLLQVSGYLYGHP